MILEQCKGVHCVDLGESFPTSIYLQKSASIQPRTSPVKFARSPRTDPPGAPFRPHDRVDARADIEPDTRAEQLPDCGSDRGAYSRANAHPNVTAVQSAGWQTSPRVPSVQPDVREVMPISRQRRAHNEVRCRDGA